MQRVALPDHVDARKKSTLKGFVTKSDPLCDEPDVVALQKRIAILEEDAKESERVKEESERRITESERMVAAVKEESEQRITESERRITELEQQLQVFPFFLCFLNNDNVFHFAA